MLLNTLQYYTYIMFLLLYKDVLYYWIVIIMKT